MYSPSGKPVVFSSFCLSVRKFSVDSFWPNPHEGFRTPRIWILDPARMQVFRCLARIPLGWGSTRWFFLPRFGNFSKVRCATPTLQVFRNQRRTLARKAAYQSCLSRPNGSSPHTLVGFFCKPFVAQTATAASFPCRNTTRNLPSLPRKPRTSHSVCWQFRNFLCPPRESANHCCTNPPAFCFDFFPRLGVLLQVGNFRFASLCHFHLFFSLFFFSLPILSFPLLDCAGVPKLCKNFFSVSCRKCGYFALFCDFLYFLELVFRRSLPIAWHFLSRRSHTILSVGGRSVDRWPPFGWSCVGFLDAASIVRAFSSFV